MRELRLLRPAAVFLAFVAAAMIASCSENLPSGPERFVAQLKIVVPHDTLVVGDSSTAQAQAFDEAGFQVSGLTFAWTSANSGILGLPVPASESPEVHHQHRDVSGGWLRPTVFGMMDGLVSNFALIAGVAGASASSLHGESASTLSPRGMSAKAETSPKKSPFRR